MTISSRTPEGTPGECPVCDNIVCIDPSQPVGDAPCPNCGVLLWVVTVGGVTRLYPHSEVSSRKQRIIEALADVSLDSLDVVETVMSLEEELKEEFGFEFDPEKLQEIHSIGELIDFIVRELPY